MRDVDTLRSLQVIFNHEHIEYLVSCYAVHILFWGTGEASP